MDNSTTGDHVPVHATVSDMYKASWSEHFDVVFRSEQNDDTEILFQGYKEECRVFVQGYVHALISQTAYYIHPDSPGNSAIVLYSPLISQWKLTIWVEETQQPEDDDSDLIPF